jgi:predicted nucleic acid-binding protein
LTRHYVNKVIIDTKVDICRDPKDNFLLALAKDASAHFIISGDNDLLTLESFALAKIISYKEFERFFIK